MGVETSAAAPVQDILYVVAVMGHRQNRWAAGRGHSAAAELSVDSKMTIAHIEAVLGGYYYLRQGKSLNLSTFPR